MPRNRFESSRISEGTLDYEGNTIGPTARAGAPEQIRNEDGQRSESPDSELRGRRSDLEGIGREKGDHARDDQKRGDSNYRRVVSAGSLIGDRVHNTHGENLGTIEQLMVDLPTGRVTYAVLSFGGFLGLGDKLFAVPWNALRMDRSKEKFILDVDRKVLEEAPGFDKSNWPDMADPAFRDLIHAHYRQEAGGQIPSGDAVACSGDGRPMVFAESVTDAGDYMGDNAQPNRSMEFEPEQGYRIEKQK